MKRIGGWPAIGVGAAILLVVALLAWRMLHKAPDDSDGTAPTALISVATARSGPVSRTVEAYGVIAGSPAATRTISAVRDVIVQQVLVTPGQPVAAGAPLVVVGDTPASRLAYLQASDALAFARMDLARVQRLFDQHIAANDQLIAAQKAAADAEAAIAAQSAAGGGQARQTIVSPIAGVVGQVSAARGQQMSAGAPLLSLVARGGFVAQFGVEPGRAGQIAVGQPVHVVSALDPNVVVDSRLSMVGQAVDPATRLIPAAAPADGAGLPLGAAVRGVITVARFQGLTVPSAAIVHDEAGAHLFVVRAGKAHQVAVTTGPEDAGQIAVTGDIRAGDPVAVAGAYQLQDGLAVRIGAQ